MKQFESDFNEIETTLGDHFFDANKKVLSLDHWLHV